MNQINKRIKNLIDLKTNLSKIEQFLIENSVSIHTYLRSYLPNNIYNHTFDKYYNKLLYLIFKIYNSEDLIAAFKSKNLPLRHLHYGYDEDRLIYLAFKYKHFKFIDFMINGKDKIVSISLSNRNNFIAKICVLDDNLEGISFLLENNYIKKGDIVDALYNIYDFDDIYPYYIRNRLEKLKDLSVLEYSIKKDKLEIFLYLIEYLKINPIQRESINPIFTNSFIPSLIGYIEGENPKFFLELQSVKVVVETKQLLLDNINSAKTSLNKKQEYKALLAYVVSRRDTWS